MLIYAAVNKYNGMAYVGATTKTLQGRKNAHFSAASARSNSTEFYRALSTLGRDAFDWWEIDYAKTKAELAKKEEAAIADLGTLFPLGYNMLRGGTDFRQHPVTAERISAAKMGCKRPDVSLREFTQEFKDSVMMAQPHRKEISLRHRGTGEVRTFPSLNEAALQLNLHLSALSNLSNRKPHFHSVKGWELI
jgi:hypothetical protein